MFWKLKGKRSEAKREPLTASDELRVADGLPLDSDAPWVQARRHMDDRFLRLAAHAANWKAHARGNQAIAAIMAVALAYIAIQWRVEPVFIEVDKLGRKQVMATGVDDGARVDKQRLLYREMVDFIENVRTVTSDYSANNKALTKAFSRLANAGMVYVKNDLQSHKPNDVAEKKTIVVEVSIAMPITVNGQRNSWQVEWTETSYDLKGEKMGAPEVWKANIQYELHPGKTEKEIDANPIGFYIPSISWAKQR